MGPPLIHKWPYLLSIYFILLFIFQFDASLAADLNPICTPSVTSTNCVYYICNRLDCDTIFGVQIDVFRNISAALEIASLSHPTSHNEFYIAPSIYKENLSINNTLLSLRFKKYPTSISEIVQFEGYISLIDSVSRLSLGFQEINFGLPRSTSNSLVYQKKALSSPHLIASTSQIDSRSFSSLDSDYDRNSICFMLERFSKADIEFNNCQFTCSVEIHLNHRDSLIEIDSSTFGGLFNIFSVAYSSDILLKNSEFSKFTVYIERYSHLDFQQTLFKSSFLIKSSGNSNGTFWTSFQDCILMQDLDIQTYLSIEMIIHKSQLYNGMIIHGTKNIVLDATYSTFSNARSMAYIDDLSSLSRRKSPSPSQSNPFIVRSLHRMTLNFENNLFIGNNWTLPGKDSSLHAEPELRLEALCNAYFTIRNNTFQHSSILVEMNLTKNSCDRGTTLDSRSSVQFNAFTKPIIDYRFYDLLRFKANPALSFINNIDNKHLTGIDVNGGLGEDLMLSAQNNYWGSPRGPYICCNPNGDGAYTTLHVQVSQWCLDAKCTNISSRRLESTCLTNGCPQQLSLVEKISFYTTFGIGTLILIIGIMLMIFKFDVQLHLRNPDSIQRSSQTRYNQFSRWGTVEDIISSAWKLWRISALISSLACIMALTNLLILFRNTLDTSYRAHQFKIPLRGFVILIVLLILCVGQLLVNIFGLLVSFVRGRLMNNAVLFMYVWNVFNICTTITLSLYWIPLSGFSELMNPFFLTRASKLTWFVYFGSLLVVLSAAAVMIPVRKLNKLIFHFELSKLSSSLEAQLLKQLQYSPELERKSKRLRGIVIISLFLSVLIASYTIHNIVTDPFLRIRFIVGLIQMCIGLLAMVATIFVTVTPNRISIQMFLIVIFVAVFLGAIQDWGFWIGYITVGGMGEVQNIVQLICSAVWLVLNGIIPVLLYRLRAEVLRQMPNIIAVNLNDHLDEKWNLHASDFVTDTLHIDYEDVYHEQNEKSPLL